MSAIQLSASSGLKTLRLIGETISWRIRLIGLYLRGMLPPPSFIPKPIKDLMPPPESLEPMIREAKLARLRAEAKLAATVRQADAVHRVAELVERMGN